MNNTFVIVVASLGGLLWLYAVLRERYKNTTGGTVLSFLKKFFVAKGAELLPATGAEIAESTGVMTIDSLERELGIEPDHYLCDRIARINEALIARRDKAPSKKKGGAS